jgi:hypothetical protein
MALYFIGEVVENASRVAVSPLFDGNQSGLCRIFALGQEQFTELTDDHPQGFCFLFP